MATCSHELRIVPKAQARFRYNLCGDRSTKQVIHVYSLPQNSNGKDMAVMYIDRIYRNHGSPESIVSDRGPQFVSAFWNELCQILGIE